MMRKKNFIVFIILIIFTGIVIGFSLGWRGSIPFDVQDKYPTVKEDRSFANLEALRSLPYATWSKEKVEDGVCGVIKYSRDKAFFGYNFYTDDARYAFLMDMNGQILHRWEFPPIKGKWEYAELLSNGEIVALCVGKCFVKMNHDSEVIWMKKIPASRDIEVLPDNTYLVIGGGDIVEYNFGKVKFESIFHVSESGEILDEWSTYKNLDKLKKLHPPIELDIKGDTKTEKVDDKKKSYEYYHTNTIEILPETTLGKKDKRFQSGNYLICLRNTSLILILDKESKDIVWSWGPGVLDFPHMPTMLENGNILIFDNGTHRSYSRIVEINPVDLCIIWEYKADPPEDFYSKWRGSNQRFPNGNTMICESERGRVFEITKEGEIVWEFLNPEIKNGKRKLIYRIMRIPKEKVEEWHQMGSSHYLGEK